MQHEFILCLQLHSHMDHSSYLFVAYLSPSVPIVRKLPLAIHHPFICLISVYMYDGLASQPFLTYKMGGFIWLILKRRQAWVADMVSVRVHVDWSPPVLLLMRTHSFVTEWIGHQPLPPPQGPLPLGFFGSSFLLPILWRLHYPRAWPLGCSSNSWSSFPLQGLCSYGPLPLSHSSCRSWHNPFLLFIRTKLQVHLLTVAFPDTSHPLPHHLFHFNNNYHYPTNFIYISILLQGSWGLVALLTPKSPVHRAVPGTG